VEHVHAHRQVPIRQPYRNGMLASMRRPYPLVLVASGSWLVLVAGCGRFGFREQPAATDASVDTTSPDVIAVHCDDGSIALPGTPCTMTFGDRTGASHPDTIEDTYVASDIVGPLGDNDDVHSDGNPVHVALWRFDLSAIPQIATVNAASLSVFVFNGAAQELSGGELDANPLLEAWDAATANFTERMPGVPWSGAAVTAPSIDDTVVVFRVVSGIDATMIDTESVLPLATATVQHWVSQPDSNLGVASHSTTGDGCGFDSSEHADPSKRPLLTVTFVLP